MSYNHHHYPFEKLIHLPKQKLCTHKAVTSLPPAPSPLATTILLSGFVNLPSLGTACTWNVCPFVSGLFHLA